MIVGVNCKWFSDFCLYTVPMGAHTYTHMHHSFSKYLKTEKAEEHTLISEFWCAESLLDQCFAQPASEKYPLAGSEIN